jgi:hypothetical protein
MKRLRTSVLGLVLIVAAFAMAFAALRSGSDIWFGTVYTFTVVLLLLTVIVARFRRGDEKAFWFGFAVFGWGFFLLGFGLWMNPLASFEFEEGEPNRLNPNLLTSGAILHAKVLDGAGGYAPGFVAIDRKITLAENEWETLNQHLEQAGFWTMPTRLEDDGGCDGDQLIVEGVKEGTYHLVDRWAADASYAGLCRHLLNLTGLDVKNQWNKYH